MLKHSKKIKRKGNEKNDYCKIQHKKSKAMIASANKSEGMFLSQIYENASRAKYDAWDSCYKLCQNEGGECFHITSHNTFGFSVAWFLPEGVRIETPKNSYLILY